jgi:stage II sporulation protein D
MLALSRSGLCLIARARRILRGWIPVWLCGAMLCACASAPRGEEVQPARADAVISEAEMDAALQRAAAEALGEREGTIIVMDARTGRLRAVINPRLAFEQAFPPGSAVKPFTALAALRAGLMDPQARTLCQERYARDGFEIVCLHPRSQSPFNLAQALAHSCNYYFARLGERLSAGAFNASLAAFGFGARTGASAAEAAGSLPHGEWRVNEALGESEQLLVTPVQLLTAYAALANGGYWHRPRHVAPPDFIPSKPARLTLSPAHRAALLEGLRGAIKYGTASRAGLASLPVQVFGKTGTSTASNGFRTQGWFIGLAADGKLGSSVPPDSIGLAVLVFLKRAHGAQCAEVARPIFAAYAEQGGWRMADGGWEVAEDLKVQSSKFKAHPSGKLDLPSMVQERQPATLSFPLTTTYPQSLKVRLVREGVTRTMELEEYLRGVLAAEASVEDEIEALKAQAVTSRTFALKNLKRHAGAGYDFCSTTHCQRYVSVGEGKGETQAATLAGRAVAETEGEVLRDGRGQLADVYFHAACGGMTADIAALWGVAAPPYLRGVRDDYCATRPHRDWSATISAARLLKAARSDARSDVGARLDEVVIVKRDASGRAEQIALEGERRRLVRGWDLKLIVGRALGWNLLKSSRFEVRRAGANFIFRGSGFGHGLGLCQEGAHVMARRQLSYRRILSHYFPGASLASGSEETARLRVPASLLPRIPPSLSPFILASSDGNRRQHWSSEHFRISVPSAIERGEIEAALRTLEAARADLLRRLEAASLTLAEPAPLEVIVHRTTQDFMAATGQPWWVAAVTRGRRMELQPLGVLRRRGVLATTLRHEYAHAVIELLGQGHAPRWLAEGLAIYVAGEGAMLARVAAKIKLTTDELERKLARPASPQEMRELYAAAYREVKTLMQAEGEARVWQRVAGSNFPS